MVRLLPLLLAAAACSTVVPTEAPHPEPVARKPVPWALLVNGGGTRAQNYQSHVLHLRGLVDVLRAGGVAGERITILSGNGADPEPDLATREWLRDDDFWLLRGTELARPLGAPIEYVRSTVGDFALRAATRDQIGRWFEEDARALRPGDTLLLYVTDHGTAVDDDPRNNRITLWGKGEHLSVADLEKHLDSLPDGVRIVLLMSQCHSGGFAHLARGDGSSPRCGYFSTTADRLASGCYPEDRGRENVGHSFEMIRALRRTGSLDAAHAIVLHDDHTPDVPLRASDVFLADRLRALAGEEKRPVAEVADALLGGKGDLPSEAGQIPALLDSLGQTFGIERPRTVAAAEALIEDLDRRHADAEAWAKAWKAARDDAVRENLARFLEVRPEWNERIDGGAFDDLSAAERADWRKEILAELEAFTKADAVQDRRLRELRDWSAETSALEYRLQVRSAAALRMRTLLVSLAGHVLAARENDPQLASARRILECEDLELPEAPAADATTSTPRRDPFPPLAADLERIETLRPSWLGIAFEPASEHVLPEDDVPRGAVLVIKVNPGSPAEAGGLAENDVVLGPPDDPFEEPREIREWTMRSPYGTPLPLVVYRDGRELGVSVELTQHPGADAKRRRAPARSE